MSAAPIDPQLELLDPNLTTQSMQYPLSGTSFEPWNSMFESMGQFPQATQDLGMLDSDFQSDSASSGSYYPENEQYVNFPMSPLEKLAMNPDESPGHTSISTSTSDPGTITKETASKSTKGKKGHRRRRSEAEKKEQIKQRNRVAASKCRMKKKEKVDELKEMKSSLEQRNNDLHQEYQRLRREIGQVKSDLIHHTECNDPNIDRWVENEAKGYVQKLVRNDEQQRMGSISSSGGTMGTIQVQALRDMPGLQSEDPYMGLG
ncbi:bzip transcription factor [Trichoderma arundinaceum]|uniref:Bzip transcription factor n=1 Tax=Trichoderma arundinaceum TaxID=490622 RepID=A0A395NAI2_TRIAR|nr:bzip transcription factor [Trichoderma arundinaceum]